MARTIQITEGDLRRMIGRCVTEAIGDDAQDIRRMFIDYIEHSDSALQHIYDCESGNENGTPFSPTEDLIYDFEDEVLGGQKCTPEQRDEIVKAYNEWWHYAETYFFDGMDESKNRNMARTIQITESRLRGMIEEAVQEALKEGQGWRAFKSLSKEAAGKDMSDEKPAGDLGWQNFKNFVNKGHSIEDDHATEGAYNPHYDEEGLPFDPADNYKPGVEKSKWSRPVNTSAWGKSGRAAGLGGAIAVRGAKKGFDTLKKKFDEKMRQRQRDKYASRTSKGRRDYE